jgi:CheY-like chemotaxis protein
MRPARILVADDDAALREGLHQVLALAGYSAVLAADGLVALERARADPPDLIILDHLMPGLDGLGVLRALQADPRLRQVPVILLTGAAADLPAAPGVAAIIEKPFRMRPLQDAVRSLLAARPDA